MSCKNKNQSQMKDKKHFERDMDGWVECVVDRNYLIQTAPPYNIKRKGKDKLVALCDNGEGYLKCILNGRNYYHHRIIALQFIENDDPVNKTEIDHINHNRRDNRIENLRWVSHADNMRNTAGYRGKLFEFVKEISPNAITIKRYGRRRCEKYYYDENLQEFYLEEAPDRFRILNICTVRNGAEFVYMYDVNGEKFQLSLNKFRLAYNL